MCLQRVRFRIVQAQVDEIVQQGKWWFKDRSKPGEQPEWTFYACSAGCHSRMKIVRNTMDTGYEVLEPVYDVFLNGQKHDPKLHAKDLSEAECNDILYGRPPKE